MKFEAAPVLLSTVTVEPIELLGMVLMAVCGLAVLLGVRRDATLFAAVLGVLVLVLSR